MIGKVVTGKSFRGCLAYCLNDKQEKQGESQEDIMKDRSEILVFNQCFGDEKELVQQFNEVRQLNTKLSSPVLHITLSLAPGEELSRQQLADICEDCGNDMGFDKNQYVGILHKDTGHSHIHIVANRVGFDGKTVSDSNSYKKIAAHCRRMETKYGLEKVLSPEKYLPKGQKNQPRSDKRKELLKEHIRKVIGKVKDYGEFEREMKRLGYEVIKSRGIAFRDGQKVYTKGSSVGFSLARIERQLALPQEERMQLAGMEHSTNQKVKQECREVNAPATSRLIPAEVKVVADSGGTVNGIGTAMANMLVVLSEPDNPAGNTDPGLNAELNRRRRRKKKSLSR
jgi:hypothetical protein